WLARTPWTPTSRGWRPLCWAGCAGGPHDWGRPTSLRGRYLLRRGDTQEHYLTQQVSPESIQRGRGVREGVRVSEVAVHMPGDVLEQQVAELPRTAGVAGLRDVGAQTHEVAGLHLHPVGVQQVERLTLQHEQAVLHHVRLREGDRGAGLQGDDVHV